MGHLLVIEIDADVRALIRRYLEKAGHCVTERPTEILGFNSFGCLLKPGDIIAVSERWF